MAGENISLETTKVLDEIYENAKKALYIAELLDDPNYREYAAHFALISWEECSKYLLVYCRDHLPAEYFRSRYRHISKYAVARGLYFLSGGLSVVWPAPGSEDTEFGVLMGPEGGHGETEVYARVQA